jgi:hypothetical protein
MRYTTIAEDKTQILLKLTNGINIRLSLSQTGIEEIKTGLNSSKNRGKVRLPEPTNSVYYWINNKKKPSGGGSGKVKEIEPPNIFGTEQLYWEYE